MIQLPEIEVIRKDLERDVVGKRIKDVTIKTPAVVARHRNRPEFQKSLEGRKIEGVSRRGTALLFELDEDGVLVIQPGPQSSLTRETATEPPGRHTQFVATFTTGGALHYVDHTKEGQLFVVDRAQLDEVEELRPRGIDPLADTFTWQAFSDQLVSRALPLHDLLDDGSFVIGLGDLYTDEILWAAGLSGQRQSSTLSSQEVRRLYRAVQEVLFEAVKQRGTGAEPVEEEDPFGEAEYGEHVRVFGREGEPCARCRQPIRKGKAPSGRATYFCPQCQT